MNYINNSNSTFVLTTPLYYVNNVPHIGSAYTTMVADVTARFRRLKGESVLMITGTDEHGQKIQRTAEANGVDAQEHCDKIAAGFDSLWHKLNIQYDRFIRTTDNRHSFIVREFFQRLWDQQDIYLSRQQGWYCVSCEEFKEERELLEGHLCPIHTNKKVEWKDEENYFFRLSKYQREIEKLHLDKPDFVQPESRRNEVLSFMSQGLQDFSISRINVDWGLPVPTDKNHTIYVWFEALLGYVTALIEVGEEVNLENALANWWPINLHLVGKDILRFHAIYWPAMLMSAGIPLPEKVFAHGFLTKDGKKMGKTLGNTIDPYELVDKYGSDAIRYYFLKEIEFGQDGDFSESRFVSVANADLANDLGNLLNRTLGMAKKYCQGRVPEINLTQGNQSNTLQAIGSQLSDRVIDSYQRLSFSKACEEIFSLVRASNKFIDEQAPWTLYKQGKQTEVERVLYSILESVRLAAYLLSPIVPNLSSQAYQQLGFGDEFDFNQKEIVEQLVPFENHCRWGILPSNQKLSQPKPIFSRLDAPNTNTGD